MVSVDCYVTSNDLQKDISVKIIFRIISLKVLPLHLNKGFPEPYSQGLLASSSTRCITSSRELRNILGCYYCCCYYYYLYVVCHFWRRLMLPQFLVWAVKETEYLTEVRCWHPGGNWTGQIHITPEVWLSEDDILESRLPQGHGQRHRGF